MMIFLKKYESMLTHFTLYFLFFFTLYFLFILFRFVITNLYTNYDPVLFAINFISLAIVLIAKLPQLHKVRLFWLIGHKFVDREK